jgi:hypothetical protein
LLLWGKGGGVQGFLKWVRSENEPIFNRGRFDAVIVVYEILAAFLEGAKNGFVWQKRPFWGLPAPPFLHSFGVAQTFKSMCLAGFQTRRPDDRGFGRRAPNP